MTVPALHDLDLPRHYSLEVVAAPPVGPKPDYEFRIRPGWRDCPWLSVRFVPDVGPAWVGAFELGDPDSPLSGFYPCPSGREVLVVGWGAGYFVTPEAPEVWWPTPFETVRGVRRVVGRDSLLVWGDADILLLDPNGPVWRIDRLSEEFLAVERAEHDVIVGTLREPGTETPRVYSLRTGDGSIVVGPTEAYTRAYVRILRRPDDRLR